MSNLVSAQWLSENLDQPDLIILDVSQGVIEEYKDQFIPGSRKFDIKNNFSDTSGPFPNTFPTVEKFQEQSRNLGINQNSTIIVYDNKGMFASPRVWWMYRTMGHQEVYVLNGGLPEWKKNNYPIVSDLINNTATGDFNTVFNPAAVKDYQFVISNIQSTKSQIIDARSAGRFNGSTPEPRQGLKSGNIPGSKNLPFGVTLRDGKMKSKEELISEFNKLDLGDEELTFSCGSGITACIILLAAEEAGLPNNKSVYDGSWTEWAELRGLKD